MKVVGYAGSRSAFSKSICLGEKLKTMLREKNIEMELYTASWGAMGVMWGKNAVTVYIRPQRYTKEFVDREDTFTISVLGEEYRKALNYCGKVSGKDADNNI